MQRSCWIAASGGFHVCVCLPPLVFIAVRELFTWNFLITRNFLGIHSCQGTFTLVFMSVLVFIAVRELFTWNFLITRNFLSIHAQLSGNFYISVYVSISIHSCQRVFFYKKFQIQIKPTYLGFSSFNYLNSHPGLIFLTNKKDTFNTSCRDIKI